MAETIKSVTTSKGTDDLTMSIREVIAYAHVLIGIPNLPSPAEDIVLVGWVRNNLRQQTLDEIRTAIEMTVNGDLPVDIEKYLGKPSFAKLSTYFLASVLREYRKWRFDKNREEMKLLPETGTISQEERDFILSNSLINLFYRYRDGKGWYDTEFDPGKYDLLARLGMINMTKEEKVEMMRKAMEYNIDQVERKIKNCSTKDVIGAIGLKEYLREIKEEGIPKSHLVYDAKKLSIKAYFDRLIAEGLDIDDEFTKSFSNESI